MIKQENSAGEKWIRFRFHRLFRVRNTLISFCDAFFSRFFVLLLHRTWLQEKRGMCLVMRMSHSERKWKCSCDRILSAADERNRSKVHFGSFHWLVVVAAGSQHHSFFPFSSSWWLSLFPFRRQAGKERCDCIQTLAFSLIHRETHRCREKKWRSISRSSFVVSQCMSAAHNLPIFSSLFIFALFLFSGSSFLCHTPKTLFSHGFCCLSMWKQVLRNYLVQRNTGRKRHITEGYRVIGIRRDAGQRVVFIQANQMEDRV